MTAERCPLDDRHLFHGLPKPNGCPGPFPEPLGVVDPTPCTRCSTGLPFEHTCPRPPVGPTTTTAPPEKEATT